MNVHGGTIRGGTRGGERCGTVDRLSARVEAADPRHDDNFRLRFDERGTVIVAREPVRGRGSGMVERD